MTGGAPLGDLRVLDLTRLLPGGYATLLLADLGADVVKVEEPGKGDYIRFTPPIVRDFSAGHIALNRNKRSVTVNLKTAEGLSLFHSLVPHFDVVIESFRPGVMDRLGAGWTTLRELNSRLVYCAITGYGQDGPRAQEAGHDVNYIGYAGILGITGEEGRRPVVPGIQIGDFAGGALGAVIAILIALRERDRTGRGRFCDVSMTDGVFSFLTLHAAEFVATSVNPRRELMHLSGAYPCYRVYPAADGFLAVGALEPQFWSALCGVLERPDLAGDAYAVGERRGEVIHELEGIFSARTRAQWMEKLQGVDACVSPVNDFSDAFADEQIRARGMLVEWEVPGVGPWTHVATPVRLDGVTAEIGRRPPPRLGEHTDEVLAEIGIGADALDDLRRAGAI